MYEYNPLSKHEYATNMNVGEKLLHKFSECSMNRRDTSFGEVGRAHAALFACLQCQSNNNQSTQHSIFPKQTRLGGS
jgi:hypothetical protein